MCDLCRDEEPDDDVHQNDTNQLHKKKKIADISFFYLLVQCDSSVENFVVI